MKPLSREGCGPCRWQASDMSADPRLRLSDRASHQYFFPVNDPPGVRVSDCFLPFKPSLQVWWYPWRSLCRLTARSTARSMARGIAMHPGPCGHRVLGASVEGGICQRSLPRSSSPGGQAEGRPTTSLAGAVALARRRVCCTLFAPRLPPPTSTYRFDRSAADGKSRFRRDHGSR